MVKNFLILALTAFSIASQFVHGRQTRGLQHTLDTLASNEIIRRAGDSLQWETVVATVTTDLQSEIQSRVESNEELSARVLGLVETVVSLEGRVATATEINVNLAAALRTDKASTTVFATDSLSLPDSITSPYDDGLLSGTIAFFPPDTDGRWSVFAAAEDSARVKLEFGEVFVQPAPPMQFCPLPVKAKWAGIGAAALALWHSR